MEELTIEQVRELFAKDRFATDNGAVVDEVGDHYAKCSMKLDDRHKNALGAIMGGVYFTLADFTFAVASNWQKQGTVSLNAGITYLAPARGEKLIAEAVCIKNGKTTNFYRVDIRDEEGTLLATVSATGYCTRH